MGEHPDISLVVVPDVLYRGPRGVGFFPGQNTNQKMDPRLNMAGMTEEGLIVMSNSGHSPFGFHRTFSDSGHPIFKD